MSTVDPNAHWVSPLAGSGLAILVVSIICGAISFIVVSLRTLLRIYETVFGLDDGLMLFAMVIFMVEVTFGCLGARSGLGARDVNLNDYMQVKSKEYLMLWMLLYVCSLVLIKASICITMLRIGNKIKLLRLCVYALLALSICTYLTTFIGILLLCSPVEANWNTALVLEGKAKCASMDAMIGLSYFSTGSSIATDLACAILPGVIVWNTQLPKSTKISVCILLSFGSAASISTMIRTPYIHYYLNPTDNLVFHIGNIVLWSNVETSIGLVLGSLPALRRLVQRRVEKQSSASAEGSNLNRRNGPSFGLTTIGGTPASGNRKAFHRGFRNPSDVGVSITTIHTRQDGGDWKRLEDDGYGNDKVPGIRTEHTYNVESIRESEHQSIGSSHDSKSSVLGSKH